MEYGESSELFCEKIVEDAEKEKEGIISRAEKSSRARIESSKVKADGAKENILKEAREKADLIEKKALSSAKLEAKRIMLKAQDAIIEKVLKDAKSKFEKLKLSPDYANFLKDLVVEGILGLDENEVFVAIGKEDFHLLQERTLKEIAEHLETKGKKVDIEVSQRDSIEDGVIIEAKNGKVIFDNTISSRMKRLENELRVIVRDEVFAEQSKD